jgi:hypothetical protein
MQTPDAIILAPSARHICRTHHPKTIQCRRTVNNANLTALIHANCSGTQAKPSRKWLALKMLKGSCMKKIVYLTSIVTVAVALAGCIHKTYVNPSPTTTVVTPAPAPAPATPVVVEPAH